MNIESLEQLELKELKKIRSDFYIQIKGRVAEPNELKFLGKLKAMIAKKRPFIKK